MYIASLGKTVLQLASHGDAIQLVDILFRARPFTHRFSTHGIHVVCPAEPLMTNLELTEEGTVIKANIDGVQLAVADGADAASLLGILNRAKFLSAHSRADNTRYFTEKERADVCIEITSEQIASETAHVQWQAAKDVAGSDAIVLKQEAAA